MTAAAGQRVLAPEVVARLSRLRLAPGRRVAGRFAGAHRAQGFGSSLDFADYRDYTPGDDPRRVDPYAYARLGRRLVKLYEAEDQAALRVVVDCSASMGFGRKAEAAREVTAALTAVAAAGRDRVRVLLAADDRVDAGPWHAGPAALPAVEARLLAAETSGHADLSAALRRAWGEGPRGPVVLVSDLLDDAWPDVVSRLGSGPADAVCLHLVGRDDLEPALTGDLRLADAETGAEVEVGVADRVLDAYAAARDAWQDDIRRACGAAGAGYVRLVDDESVEHLVGVGLANLGVVR